MLNIVNVYSIVLYFVPNREVSIREAVVPLVLFVYEEGLLCQIVTKWIFDRPDANSKEIAQRPIILRNE